MRDGGRNTIWWRSGRSGAPSSRPLVIVGTGAVATAFADACVRRGITARLLPDRALDLSDEWQLARLLAAASPWALVAAPSCLGVEDAEQDPASCLYDDTRHIIAIASACEAASVRVATFSTDLVFDGRAAEPYVETSDAVPLSVYGRGKATIESLLRMLAPDALVIRPGAVFGVRDDDLVGRGLWSLALHEPFLAADDLVISPTYLPDLADATLDLLIDNEFGVWHVANDGVATWAELVEATAKAAGVGRRTLVRAPHEELGWAAPRPAYSALRSGRGVLLPSLHDAVGRYAHGL